MSWAEVQSDWMFYFNWNVAALNTCFAKRFILTSHISYSSCQVVHSDISCRKGVAHHFLGNPREMGGDRKLELPVLDDVRGLPDDVANDRTHVLLDDGSLWRCNVAFYFATGG